MADIVLKRKEAKTITFTITDSDGSAVDVSSATLTFAVKQNITDSTVIITKADGDFDKTQAANGIVTCILTATDTDRSADDFVGELKIYFSASNVDKSSTINISIKEAVTD